jgi:hypothetical protein
MSTNIFSSIIRPQGVVDLHPILRFRIKSMVAFAVSDDGWCYMSGKPLRDTLYCWNMRTDAFRELKIPGSEIRYMRAAGREVYYTDARRGELCLVSHGGEHEARVSGLANPAGFCFDGPDCYVAEYADNSIARVRDGEIVERFAPGGIYHPIGIAKVGDRLYVANSGNGKILELDAGGIPLGAYGSHGPGDTQFNYPHSVLELPGRMLAVSDSSNKCVKILGPNLTFRSSSYGADGRYMECPQNMALAGGRLLVCCSHSMRIFQYELWSGKF